MFGNDAPSSADIALDAATSNKMKIEYLEKKIQDLETRVREMELAQMCAIQTADAVSDGT